MEEPEGIFKAVTDYFAAREHQPLKGKRVMITAGPTREKIDPVRFISNYSTGKMGYALADAAARLGADVTLISGPVEVRTAEKGVTVVEVESGREMLGECEKVFPRADVAIMCAAVADYYVENPSAVKTNARAMSLLGSLCSRTPISPPPSAASSVAGRCWWGLPSKPTTNMPTPTEKMERKNLDMIVMNSLRDAGAGFGTDTNKVEITYRNGAFTTVDVPLKSKTEVAADIMRAIIPLTEQ